MEMPSQMYNGLAEKMKSQPTQLLLLMKEHGFRKDEQRGSLGPFPDKEEFREFFRGLSEAHQGCGVACSHLLKFYEILMTFQKGPKREVMKLHKRDVHRLPSIRRPL